MLAGLVSWQLRETGRAGQLKCLADEPAWQVVKSGEADPSGDAELSGRLTFLGGGPVWEADLSGKLTCLVG